MDKKNLEWKVGLFVFFALILVAALLLQFSKGTTFFRGTYQIQLHAANVGGLKARSAVLMSGVQVGTVSDIKLATDGKSVTIFLKIFREFVIHKDARFLIEQSGFLGDQYVAIVPTQNEGEPLANNASVDGEEPFNLQEVARSAGGFIKRIDETAKKFSDTVSDVHRLLLNEKNLTNLAYTVDTLRAASDRALGMVNDLDTLLATNAPLLAYGVSNAVASSEEIKLFTGSLNSLLATNSDSIAAAVKNIESSTVVLKDILEDAHAGKGLAGTLLHDEQIGSNVVEIVNNLSITSSNLNRLGLWGILWSKKPPRNDATSKTSPH